MARGDLVSDDIVIAVAEQRLAAPDARRGFILDGFPRTPGQASGARRDARARSARRSSAASRSRSTRDEIVQRLLQARRDRGPQRRQHRRRCASA
jgi:adenylate kinase